MPILPALAGLLRNPNFSLLFPVGPKPFEFLLTLPIEGLWERPRRVEAAKANLDAVSQGLVQHGLDLARDAKLATITLTPQAEQRLGIETVPASLEPLPRSRTLAGEVVLPPDRAQMVLSPVAGTLAAGSSVPAAGSAVDKGQILFRVQPMVAAQRDMAITAEAELTAAKNRLDIAQLRRARAEQMLRIRWEAYARSRKPAPS